MLFEEMRVDNQVIHCFKLESIGRSEIDKVVGTIQKIYTEQQAKQFTLLMIDVSSPSITLTDYLKQIIQTKIPINTIFNGALAIVLSDTASSLRLFLNKFLRQSSTPRTYFICNDIDQGVKWLVEQATDAKTVQIPQEHSALVVEDDPRANNLFVKLLMRQNYKYRTVSRGDHALDMLQTYYPHVILLDIHLPGASGIEILEYINNTSHFGHTTIITVSASATVFETLKSGAHYAFHKPISPREISALLAEIKGTLS